MKERETPAEAQAIRKLPPAPKGSGDTVIRKGTTVNGTLSGNGGVTVEGTVDGEIAFDGSVTVAVSGVIKGPVAANILRAAGTIEGNVTAKERLVLESTGQIQGDVETVSLVIEDGGRLNGRATTLGKPVGDAPLPDKEEEPEEELLFGPNYPGGWEYRKDGQDEGSGQDAPRKRGRNEDSG